MREGKVIEGIITGIERCRHRRYWSENRRPYDLREFCEPGSDNQLKVGDTVEVFLERIENALGQAVLSDKARREELGQVSNSTKRARPRHDRGSRQRRLRRSWWYQCLPAGFQVDIRPVRDIGPLMGTEQPFQS